MSVSPFVQPDYTNQSGSAYPTNIDNAVAVMKRVSAAFSPQAQSSPNMTVYLLAGQIFDGITLTEVAAQSTGAITAPVADPRIDRVVIDAVTGIVSVVAGAEAVTPSAPAVPAGKLPVAQISLQTSTTTITNSMITDERILNRAGMIAAKQTSLASAATTDLGSAKAENILITGTTTITAFGSSASVNNPLYFIKFDDVLILTHNGTSLIIPGGSNITTAAGDTALAEYLGSGNWRIRDYCKADGQALYGIAVSVFAGKVLNGLTLSNNATDLTNDIDIAAGSCVSDDGTTVMTLAANTFQSDVAWAVGTNTGALDTGVIGNGTYHVWIIHRPDTGVTSRLISLSATAPTMPANYTKKKCIGSIIRASGAIRRFTQNKDYFALRSPTLDVNQAATGINARTGILGVPTGVEVLADLNLFIIDNASYCYISPLASEDMAPDNGAGPLSNGGAGSSGNVSYKVNNILTDTAASIRYRTSTSTTIRMSATGWRDPRI